MLAIVIAFGAVTVFALEPLPRVDGFVPTFQGIVAVLDLLTAVLLYGQFIVTRSRALLVLASAYLASSLLVVAHTMTFPGAYTPSGLLGAGAQTAAWLYVAWHIALPAGVIYYALRKRTDLDGVRSASRTLIVRSIVVVAATAALLTWGATALHDRLPELIANERSFYPLASTVTFLADFLLTLTALAILWARRATLLDDWLMVALTAALSETALIAFLAASRYTVSFYSVRAFAVIVSGSVLAALLWEMTRLYAQLSLTARALHRERESKLMSLGLMVGAFAHEVRQPLSVIKLRNGVMRRLLMHRDADVSKLQENLAELESETGRVEETIDSIRALFSNPDEGHADVDINDLVVATLEALDTELNDQKILVSTELAMELPPIAGHKGQLREVLINLVKNAIEAMSTVDDRLRVLRVKTTRDHDWSISISIEDTGCGIEPDRLATLFDSFVTTKAGGTGLGLGICRLIVDRHEGTLAASSEPGKRTRFDITLPPGPATAAPKPRPQRTQGRKRGAIPHVRGSA